jgi:hypothetical protein
MRPPGRTRTHVAIALALLVGVGWGATEALDSAANTASPAAASGCRSDPLVGVHDPSRLKILNRCATYVGTVVKAPTLNRGDGDVTFNVKPDPGYEWMLNAHNRSSDGGLHLEIIPIDQPSCRSGCSGANVIFPPLGAHVRVTGAYVFDSWSGPNEIHPVWKVELLRPGAPPPPPPPPAPQVVRLKAWLTGKGLGTSAARDAHGRVALTLTAERVCWKFTQLARVGSPTRASIRFKEQDKPGRTVRPLGRPFRARGCVPLDAKLFESLVQETHDYYVLVASKRHRYGAIRGRLTRAT